MKRLNNDDLQKKAAFLRLLVYGNPGTGKSWLCASACLDEATSPVLYLHYRGQVASLQSNPDFVKALADGRLVLLELEAYKELNHVYTYLFKGGKGKGVLSDLFPNGPPKTVVVDSLTELQREEVMRRAGNVPGQFLTDVERPQIRDWGQLLDQFILLAKLFYDLPMHVVFTGLENVLLDKTEKVESRGLAMAGQAQRLFPAYALTVMRLEPAPRNSPHHVFGKTKTVKACVKDQTGRIPDIIPGPTIPMLARLLVKSKEVPHTPAP